MDWVGQLADDDSDDLEEFFGNDNSDDDELLRKECWDHSRLVWKDHVEKLIHKDAFKREYRMSIGAWEKLKPENTLILYCYYYTLVTVVVGF